MVRDPVVTEQLRKLLAQITRRSRRPALFTGRNKFARRHRYAEWNETVLIIGPGVSDEDQKTPRYVRFSPLFKQQWTEINSIDPELHDDVLALIDAVEASTGH